MPEVKSVCPYCGVGCGVILKAEENRLIGLRPDPEHPVNRGTLCPKGATAHEFVHHPDRLQKPLLRTGGRLTEVSWDEAYDYIVRELTRIKQRYGPDAIGVISSSRATVEENYLAQKFARAVLGTNNIDQCFRICHSATVAGLALSLGSGAMTNAIAEFAEPGPKVLMLVGSNAPHAHPIIWTVWMKRAVKNGTKLIVIDPRTTEPAKLAAVHVKVKPGTEVALFNAMAQHIIAHNLHDTRFIEERCENFEQFWGVVQKYTPESVEKLCGVPAAQIKQAAELYACEKPASIAYGLGVTEHRTGTDNVRALCNLALITGNFGKESSGINALRGQNNVQGATDMCRPETLPGYQSWNDPAVIEKFERAWGVKLPVPSSDAFLFCSRMWERALMGELKAFYIIGSDPALTEGNITKVEKALQSAELVIVQDLFPSRTMQFAHVVLPAASFAEKDGTFVNSERRVQRIRKAIEPIGQSKPDWVILCEVAQRLGYTMSYRSPEKIFEEIRALVSIYAGISYRRLEEHYGLQWPCPTEDHPGTKFLHRERFTRGRAQLIGIDYFPPAELPDAEFPLVLTTGRTFMQYNCGTMTRRTKAGRAEPENFVQLSAADAQKLGVTSGDRVRVRTRRGELIVTAQITEIAEGVIWMPFHYAESPTNLLTNDAVDPICGITELKVCAARVERVA
uniref:Formate dehydrogenase, alpha subunit n=2 Tax=Candidatus Bipolaricaulota TaxID=67810 RepID=H5SP15_9BACT|nr:formate dehydrogenase, alpha subunit [uncultured Acetothermia bacterium]BAL59024.1 formate dehydrogenase, alpha subunit [Candidatus Acetothermum autotrophicum]